MLTFDSMDSRRWNVDYVLTVENKLTTTKENKMNLQQQIEERLREQTEMVKLIAAEIDRVNGTVARCRSLVGPDLKVHTAKLVGCWRAPGCGYIYSVESLVDYGDHFAGWNFEEQVGYLHVLRECTDGKIEQCFTSAVLASPVQPAYRSLSGRAEMLK